jgi:hypothetical protein
MQHLTNEHLRESCRRAIQEGTLGALTHRSEGKYLYDDGSKCAIGCALDLPTLEAVLAAEQVSMARTNGYLIVSNLVAQGLITCENPLFAAYLQQVHDGWATSDYANIRQGYRDKFLRLIEWTGPIPGESA